jgi:hypothetical protein
MNNRFSGFFINRLFMIVSREQTHRRHHNHHKARNLLRPAL